MGPAQQKPSSGNQNDDFPKINHEVFSNRTIVKNGPEEEAILVKVAVPHQKDYQAWVDKLKKVGQNEGLLLPKKHNFQKEGFCGMSGVVEIYYQIYPFLLSDQINNRQCLGTKFFEQNELWYLILTLLSAAQYFHSQKRKVGDIRPQNIFISEDGSVKVACILSWPNERTNYEKSFEKQITYIAPEEVNELSFAKTDPSSSFELSETFSIGLTLLDAATLSDSTDLYKGSKSFNFEGLETKLKDLQKKQEYSILLKALICHMCNASPESRTVARELYEWLSPFEEEINNFDNFETSQLPQKLRQEIEKAPRSPPKINHPPPAQTSLPRQHPPIQTSPTRIPPPQVQSQYYHPPPSNIVTSSHFSYNAPTTTSNVEYRSYVPPAPSPIPTASRGTVNGSVGFSYQTTGSTTPPSYVTASNPITIPPPSNTVQSVVRPVTISSNVPSAESTYVPYSSKFSLEKIDEQLEQSRKMFPGS